MEMHARRRIGALFGRGGHARNAIVAAQRDGEGPSGAGTNACNERSASSLGLGGGTSFSVGLFGEEASLGLKLLLHQVGQLPLLRQHRQKRADELVVVVRPSAVVHHIFTPLVNFILERALTDVDLGFDCLQQGQQVVRRKRMLLSQPHHNEPVYISTSCCA